jgi:hypothetical protein
MVADIVQARKFVQTLDLPIPLTDNTEAESSDLPVFDFKAAKNQAMVVGSEIVGFVNGVTDEHRSDILHSTLLAELAADKAIRDPKDILGWYSRYFEVLKNVGWIVQEQSFTTYAESGQEAETYKSVLAVAANLLDQSALRVVEDALKKLQSDRAQNSWLSLFEQKSLADDVARFQITLAEQGAKDHLLVTLMAFSLMAKSKLTQVLFLKFRSSEVTLKHCGGKVTPNPQIITGVREVILQRVGNHAAAYVKDLDIS